MMKKSLIFLFFLSLSLGIMKAQEPAKLNFILEATGTTAENAKESVPFLKSTQEWKITAKTFYKGEAASQWGSRILTVLQEESEGYSGFEFYLRPQEYSDGTAGLMGINNKYGLFNTEPFTIDYENGILFTFEIVSDGSGVIKANFIVGEDVFTFEREDVEGINMIGAAQNYDVEVEVEYYPEYLSVTPTKINFGNWRVGQTASQPKVITIAGSSDYSDKYSYSYTIEEGNKEVFYIIPDNFNENTGGILDIYCMPESEDLIGEHKMLLSVTRGEQTKTIEITAYVAPASPIETETWYRLVFDKRSGYCLTDVGDEEPLEAIPYSNENEGQLWQFKKAGTDEQGMDIYQIEGKLGRTIGFRYEQKEGETVLITPRYIATTDNSNTFSFVLREDKGWEIKWNEYQLESTKGALLNKGTGNYEFTAVTSTGAGTSILFLKENEAVNNDLGLPKFSNDNEENWYFIQFERVKGKGLDYVVDSSETVYDIDDETTHEESKLSQKQRDKEDLSQYWKLVGNRDEFLVVDQEGNAWGINSTRITSLTEGDYYQMIKGNYYGAWQLFNLSDVDNTYRYVNDFSGTSSLTGQWSLYDDGASILFIPVTWSGNNNPSTELEHNDPVVSVSYYSLQGIQFMEKPKVEGVYIEKSIHASKKVSARKLYIPKN